MTETSQRKYAATYNGRRVSKNSYADRRTVQMYVNRNNAAALRLSGDDSKPYAVVEVTDD